MILTSKSSGSSYTCWALDVFWFSSACFILLFSSILSTADKWTPDTCLPTPQNRSKELLTEFDLLRGIFPVVIISLDNKICTYQHNIKFTKNYYYHRPIEDLLETYSRPTCLIGEPLSPMRHVGLCWVFNLACRSPIRDVVSNWFN